MAELAIRLHGTHASRNRGVRARFALVVASISPSTAGGPPKLLEYNADTPTALSEHPSQWHWLRRRSCPAPQADQFNSLH
jgi:glutathionylspermidine synthase